MGRSDPGISDEAVRKATGRGWDEWAGLLDGAGAAERDHKEIVALVRDEGEVESGWWQQSVAVGYEKLRGLRATGETKETGYQIGVQRTLPVDEARAWEILTSDEGMAAWLGTGAAPELEEGESYRLEDGAAGEIRVVRPGERVRLTWQPGGWPRPSTIQARVEGKEAGRAVIAFHEEHLPGEEEREARRTHFKAALEKMKGLAGP